MRPEPLPQPDADALASSRRLLERIAAELAANGNWISFARYMELALHEPGMGYYAAGSRKFGAGGDFVTAPELTPLYGRTLARQVKQVLAPGEAVLEFGAGSGALAEQILGEIQAPYFILETSPELRQRQEKRLGTGFPGRVQWLERMPKQFRGVIVANEVVDAMPVHALSWHQGAIHERGVCENENQLAWSLRPATGALLDAAEAIAVEGEYQSEISLIAPMWIKLLSRVLERGAVFVIDYGFPASEYYHPQRSMGTLACHYRHRSHADPFFLPGLQDITAHVDFSALAQAGEAGGLTVLGFTGQGHFLVNCGITGLLQDEDPADPARYLPAASAVQKLLSPSEMGELFKVLALGRGVDAPPHRPLLGFGSGDRSHAL